MLEPVFSAAAQAHTATYRAPSELQPESGLKTLLVTDIMILKKDLKNPFWNRGSSRRDRYSQRYHWIQGNILYIPIKTHTFSICLVWQKNKIKIDPKHLKQTYLGASLTNKTDQPPLGGGVVALFFLHHTVTSLWTKQRLSQAVSREAMRQPVNCGFSLKYFGLTVWKECKGPHLFHSLDPTLSVEFHFFSHWSHRGWSHTHIKHKVLRGKENCMDKTLKSQYSSQFQGSIWGGFC